MSENIVLFSNLDDQVRYQPISGILPALWTPAELTADNLWLDANDATTITEVTGVSNWADKSTVGTNDASQATGSAQPPYDSINKKVTFDGTNHIMNFTSVTINSSFSVYVLAKNTASANTLGIILGYTANNNGIALEGNFGNVKNASMTDPASGSNATSLSPDSVNTNLSQVDFHNTDNKIYRDGLEGSYLLTSFTSAGTTISRLGGSANVSAYKYSGDIHEIIVMNAQSPTAERQKIQGYIAWKWDGINGDTVLTDALPAGHPYKSAAPMV